jgi:hypothetical protein
MELGIVAPNIWRNTGAGTMTSGLDGSVATLLIGTTGVVLESAVAMFIPLMNECG